MVNVEMLRENVKVRLRHEKMLRDQSITKKPMSGGQRAVYVRARRCALKGIKDLTLLLENLPEKQLDQIFNVETMRPFLDALLSFESEDKELRVKRIKSLWRLILQRDPSYAMNLVGRDTWKALTGQMDSSLRAIYYAAVNE
jgi:hypothetical protein